MMVIIFFKQKTAYEMRISDWSSDVCSSDLQMTGAHHVERLEAQLRPAIVQPDRVDRNGQRLVAHRQRDVRDLAPLQRETVRQLRRQQLGRASRRERVWQYV